MIFVDTKKVGKKKFFLSFGAVVCWLRDPEPEIRDK